MTFLGAAIITFAYGAIGDARCSRSLQELMPLVSRIWWPGMHNFRDDFDTYCDTNIMAPSSESASGKDWWRKNFQEHWHCSSDLIYTWFMIHDLMMDAPKVRFVLRVSFTWAHAPASWGLKLSCPWFKARTPERRSSTMRNENENTSTYILESKEWTSWGW